MAPVSYLRDNYGAVGWFPNFLLTLCNGNSYKEHTIWEGGQGNGKGNQQAEVEGEEEKMLSFYRVRSRERTKYATV